jgi:predicted MPP superfamily phosphohydrolase
MRWIIFISIYLIVDIYAFQAVRTIIRNPWMNGLYAIVSIGVLLSLIYILTFTTSGSVIAPPRNYIFAAFLITFFPKVLLVVFMLGEDVMRFIVGLYNKAFIADNGFYMPSRRKFISTMAIGIAAIPFTSLLYGVFKGKYNYKVLTYELEFDDLPEAFDGYTITQISDIHSGSFDKESSKDNISYAVNLINEQLSDVILFTGDLVNNVTEEMTNWKSTFSKLYAKDGVYSILGNHDYGDYMNWESKEAKAKNFSDLLNLQKDMGWDLLLNEHRYIEKNGERIALIGVENWGIGGFKKAGDLDKACDGISFDDFKILMSHDPSHWKEIVKKDPRHIQLTLSGHTHGMQFGIEIPGFLKWSPVKYRYENWAGIYEEMGRYLNVNRGLGYIGYPGRVGIWPEISVIKLKRSMSIA